MPRAPPCRRERCVSPTSATDAHYAHPVHAARFPTAPTFAPRSLSTSRPSSLVLIHRRRACRACARRSLAMNHRVDVRLTANLQLRPCHNPPGVSFRSRIRTSRRRDSIVLVRTPRIPGRGASIESPSAPCFPSAALSATGEHVAPPLTPLVATAPFEPDLSIRPALAAARIRFHPRLVKGNGFVAPGTPSLDECPLRASSPSNLGLRFGQTMGHRIIESPPPYPRLRHAARPRPASSVLFVGEGSRASQL